MSRWKHKQSLCEKGANNKEYSQGEVQDHNGDLMIMKERKISSTRKGGGKQQKEGGVRRIRKGRGCG